MSTSVVESGFSHLAHIPTKQQWCMQVNTLQMHMFFKINKVSENDVEKLIDKITTKYMEDKRRLLKVTEKAQNAQRHVI
jgi:hypothetical protein